MKKIRAKQVVVALVGALTVALTSAGLIYAWTVAQGRVQGISVSVGSSGLLINGSKDWTADVSYDNILPGWSAGPIGVEIQNISQGIDFNIQAKALLDGLHYTALADSMELAIQPAADAANSVTPTFHSLSWWATSPATLAGGPLAEGLSRNYYLLFRFPETAGDEVQSLSLNLSLLFTGVQLP